MTTPNPFFECSPLQHHAPQFDKIHGMHYEPALKRGMEEQSAEIEAIKSNASAPTFENTVVALEASGQLLSQVLAIFMNLCMANTTPEMQALKEAYAPKLAQHQDGIYLDSTLYQRVHAVYEAREALSGEELRLVEVYEQMFTIAGANLGDAEKAQLKEVNGRLATLESVFESKLLAARRCGALVVNDVAALEGLSEGEVAAAQAEAKALGHEGKYALALLNTTQQPLFVSLHHRDTRRLLYHASITRATRGDDNDTRETLEEMVRLRLRKAQLLQKKCFADWQLQDQMAETASAVELLQAIAAPALAKAREEAAAIQSLVHARGETFEIAPWDWSFYAEQVRKQRYDLDESELRPYFELKTVLQEGVFFVAEQLYGISFKQRTDLPVYDPDVVVYEVFDADGSSLALYYLDFFTRPNKAGGAWMTNFVEQSTLRSQRPVIANVFNFTKPADAAAVLLSFSEVTTVFHEFGHSLHGFFADQKYTLLGGISNVPRDFVEFPSQINEQWALDPKVLRNYAVHHDSKEPIPQTLVDKLLSAAKFNQGFETLEIVEAAVIDLQWHTVQDEREFKPTAEFDSAALEKNCASFTLVPPRYSSSYFAHIFAGGYASGYYAYLWAETLDHDGFEWFKANGGLCRANGDRFRKFILSKGNSVDLNAAFVQFAGRKPSIKPLLRARGLIA